MNEAPMNNALGILKATGVMLPLASATIYFIGPHIPHDDGLLVFVLGVTVVAGVIGYCLGMRCNGKLLTIAGLSGYVIFAAMVALLKYLASRPISIPPYP